MLRDKCPWNLLYQLQEGRLIHIEEKTWNVNHHNEADNYSNNGGPDCSHVELYNFDVDSLSSATPLLLLHMISVSTFNLSERKSCTFIIFIMQNHKPTKYKMYRPTKYYAPHFSSTIQLVIYVRNAPLGDVCLLFIVSYVVFSYCGEEMHCWKGSLRLSCSILSRIFIRWR